MCPEQLYRSEHIYVYGLKNFLYHSAFVLRWASQRGKRMAFQGGYRETQRGGAFSASDSATIEAVDGGASSVRIIFVGTKQS